MRQHSSRSPMPARLESRVGMPLSAEANTVAGTVIGITGREGAAYINLNARGPDEFFIFSDGFTVDGEGNAEFGGDIGAISGNFEIVRGGRWENLEVSPTRGIRLDTTVTKPITWQYYIDMAATGSDLILRFPGLEITADGDATFDGELDGATGTFSGALSAATGTFAGALSAASGTFAGTVQSQTFTAAQATFSGDVVASAFRGGSAMLASVANISFGGTACTIDATSIGFYGNAPQSIRTVSGSRGGNAALASLCSQLASAGLIVDSTSA